MAARAPVSPAVAQQAREAIERTDEALAAAIEKLDDRWWKTDPVEAALGLLRGNFTRLVGEWRARGEAALRLGGEPAGSTWARWLTAGEELRRGIAEQVATSDGATLANLGQTAQDAAADTAKLAASAERVAKRVGRAVGDTAAAAVTPVAGPLTGLALAAALGLGAVVLLKGRR